MSVDPVICHRCGALAPRGEGAFWVVRIEAIADPSAPSGDALDESGGTSAANYDDLLAALEGQSEREIMDQVHRRLGIELCTSCFRSWIENPTGE